MTDDCFAGIVGSLPSSVRNGLPVAIERAATIRHFGIGTGMGPALLQ